ncbi:MAG: RDD family protein [Enterobacterales bacterium]|nr:RDD family protein [Enterobacterales bacterium]
MPKASQSSQSKAANVVSVTLAPFWRRLFAWIYDLLGALGVFILALLVGQILLYLVTLPFVDDYSQMISQLSRNPWWALYLFSVVQYYYIWCWVKGGQTIGMKTWNIKVYRPDGQLLDWREGYIRSFASLGGIGNLWSLIDKEKRGLQDLAVDSRVVVLPKGYHKKHNKPLI